MQIKIKNEPDKVTLYVDGRIDTTTAPVFREKAAELEGNVLPLTIDFRDVQYISSAGLRELLILQKKYQETGMKVVNVNDDVNEIFQATGFDTLLDIEKASMDLSRYIQLSFKEFLKNKAEHQGDDLMMTCKGVGYTWGEAEKLAQIIASDLKQIGVRKGTHVGICSTNSANWILTYFAIQKLGAVAMLLNSNYLVPEIIKIASFGDITHLCFGDMPELKDRDEFIRQVTDINQSCIAQTYDIREEIDFKKRLDEYGPLEGMFESKVESDSPCTMIFTSGSTGRPKGVLLSAYNILNASSTMTEIIRVAKGDKLCLILPLFHIFGLTAGMFTVFIGDGSLCMPKDIRTDTILETIEKEQCTMFHAVPTMFLALINNKNFTSEKVKTLRASMIAGAATKESQLIEFQNKFPGNHFMNAYGLSEMAPVSMCGYEDTQEHITKTIGKPVKNIKIKIQNSETREECPTGVPGEILVQGYNLMTCYYKVDIDDQSIDQDGWLHTGDLGFMDQEGYAHLSGRKKELIIRGGENITPGEIEEVIAAQEGVADVKVVGVPHEFFGEEVAAAVVMKGGCTFDEEKMRTDIKPMLAKFKLPAYYTVYDEFPLLANGKIDMVSLKKDVIAKAEEIRKKKAEEKARQAK